MREFTKKAISIPFVDGGRDFSGWDCWGLILAIYEHCFRIRLPYGEGFSCEAPEAAAQALLDGAKAWVQVPIGREKIGDVILAKPCHVGVVLGKGRMIHCRYKTDTVIEHYDNTLWRRQIIGIYRHARLASNTAA